MLLQYIVVITGGAPKEGDDMHSATPEVRQIEGTSITESKVNGRPCRIYIQPTPGLEVWILVLVQSRR